MKFGASMFFTDDSMTPTARAVALKERGFDAVWAPEDIDTLRRYRDLGVVHVSVSVPSAQKDEVLPILDRWAELIRQL